MPDAFNAIQHWRRHAHQLRQGTINRFEELSVSDYPEATAHQVIEFMVAFFSELKHQIDRARTEQELRFLSQIIDNQGIFLEWLDNAHTAQTPRALAQLLKSLMDRLEPDSAVVVVPQAQYNYSIRNIGYHFKDLVKNWIPKSRQSVFDRYVNKPIKLIHFPRIERDNIVAHAIFGHELGHPIATAFLESELTDPSHLAAQSEIHKKVAIFVQEKLKGRPNGDSADELKLKTRVFNNILQIRLRAIEEFVSDYVGYRIFGPSAVFAMHDLLWTGDWDEAPKGDEWYPPSRMRMRLMVKQLDRSMALKQFAASTDERIASYGNAVSAFIEQLTTLVRATSDTDKISADPVLDIAYQWMNESLQKAFDFAEIKVSNALFDVDSVQHQLPELLHRLELGIPPNEIGTPLTPTAVDCRTALLAAWIYKLRGLDQDKNPLSMQAIDKLNLQTLLAVEYVILRDRYAAHITASGIVA